MGHLCAQVLPTPDVHWLPGVPVQGPSHAQGVSESPPAQCREGEMCFGTTWSAGALSQPPLPRRLSSSGLATAPRARALLTPASRWMGRALVLIGLDWGNGRDCSHLWEGQGPGVDVALSLLPPQRLTAEVSPQTSPACPCWVSPTPGGEAGGAGWAQPREGWVEPGPVMRSPVRSMALDWARSGCPVTFVQAHLPGRVQVAHLGQGCLGARLWPAWPWPHTLHCSVDLALACMCACVCVCVWLGRGRVVFF